MTEPEAEAQSIHFFTAHLGVDIGAQVHEELGLPHHVLLRPENCTGLPPPLYPRSFRQGPDPTLSRNL